jgi:hypothetical protein
MKVRAPSPCAFSLINSRIAEQGEGWDEGQTHSMLRKLVTIQENGSAWTEQKNAWHYPSSVFWIVPDSASAFRGPTTRFTLTLCSLSLKHRLAPSDRHAQGEGVKSSHLVFRIAQSKKWEPLWAAPPGRTKNQKNCRIPLPE